MDDVAPPAAVHCTWHVPATVLMTAKLWGPVGPAEQPGPVTVTDCASAPHGRLTLVGPTVPQLQAGALDDWQATAPMDSSAARRACTPSEHSGYNQTRWKKCPASRDGVDLRDGSWMDLCRDRRRDGGCVWW